MSNLRKAAEELIEAWDWDCSEPRNKVLTDLIEDIRQALAQPEWVELTNLEIIDMAKSCDIWGGDTANAQLEFAATLQAKLKEKNT